MLHAKNFGLACAILWGVSVFVLGMFAKHMGWGTEMVMLLGSFYKGYDMTFLGSVIGGVWGFVEGLVGGYIFACLYNSLTK